MREKLKEGADEKIAVEIAPTIGALDKLVFERDLIKRITLIKRRPKRGSVRVAYAPKEITKDEIEQYLIFVKNLDKWIKEALENQVILLRESYQIFPKSKLMLKRSFLIKITH